MLRLRPYQLEAVKDIVEKRRVLIADDMGLGKCAEAASAKTAIENRAGYDVPTLITCPSAVMEHWADEIRLWYKKKEDSRIVQIETSTFDRDVRRAENSDVAIIGYPTLSYFGNSPEKIAMLGKIGFQYGIIDEAHNAKNPESMRSMAVKKLYDKMDHLAILTGTPIPNTVIDLYRGRFSNQKQLHDLIQANKDEVYELIGEGLTNLGAYIGDFSLADRSIIPVLIGQAISGVAETDLTASVQDKLVRIFRNSYGPRFNDNPRAVMGELERSIETSEGIVRGIYGRLYSHYQETFALQEELN